MKQTIARIHKAVDALFERMKDRLLGVRITDKVLSLSTDRPDLTLAGIAISAAADGGARMSPQTLSSLANITGSYLDAAKERAKAKIVHDVLSAKSSGSPEAIGGALSATWEAVTNDVMRIADTETQRSRAMGTLEGVTAMSLSAGVQDPIVFFVVVRDGHRCSECTRLHLLPDVTTPRVWKLSEVGTGYHKKGDPNPKLAGLHPHCRCTMTALLPGYGFDAGGSVRFIAVGHNEWEAQRSVRKAEAAFVKGLGRIGVPHNDS